MSVLESLRQDLETLAATEQQRSTLEANPDRAVAAIAQARRNGAHNVVSYALSVFRSAEFNPISVDQPLGTNRFVARNCATCDGDRLVLFGTRTETYNGHSGVFEEYAPCPDCNQTCNTTRMGSRSPDPARVRERLSRQ